MKPTALLFFSFIIAGCSQTINPDYHYLLNQPGRWQEDLERDPSSKPLEVIHLMAIEPGMAVLDFQAGTGYFTELLSHVVGPNGKVYAHNHSKDGVLGDEVFQRRYGGNRLSNVEQIFAKHNDLDLPSNSLDRILLSMVYHDTYWQGENVDWGPVDHQAFLSELRDALKPDGEILVLDHSAASGTNPYESAVATHRIDPEIVNRDFSTAGFILLEESDIFHNSQDDHTLEIFQPGIYRMTDRFIKIFSR